MGDGVLLLDPFGSSSSRLAALWAGEAPGFSVGASAIDDLLLNLPDCQLHVKIVDKCPAESL